MYRVVYQAENRVGGLQEEVEGAFDKSELLLSVSLEVKSAEVFPENEEVKILLHRQTAYGKTVTQELAVVSKTLPWVEKVYVINKPANTSMTLEIVAPESEESQHSYKAVFQQAW